MVNIPPDALHGFRNASGRAVMEGEPKWIWSLLPYGESEHPGSRHNDQAILHSQQKVKPFWFTRDEILKNTESTWGDPKRF